VQSRPYDGRDALKIWLSPEECEQLLAVVAGEGSKKPLAFRLGLHGLRTEELVRVAEADLRMLEDSTRRVLVVETAKKQANTARDVPVSEGLARAMMDYRADAGRRIDEPLIDAAKRTVREWMELAREELAELLDDDRARELSMHDLRRTWATSVYYSLAFAGVPIAEQLTMSWGGWEQTATGRAQFRQDYLGPVPDHVTERAVDHLELV
jgi:integrase